MKKKLIAVYAVQTHENEWTVEAVVRYDGKKADVWGTRSLAFEPCAIVDKISILTPFHNGGKNERARYVLPCLVGASTPTHHDNDYDGLVAFSPRVPLPQSVLPDNRMLGYTSMASRDRSCRHLLIFQCDMSELTLI